MNEDHDLSQEREEAKEPSIPYLSEERGVIAFKIPEEVDTVEEEPEDDFYELTLNEAKKLYQELQKTRKDLEEAPLMTKKHREELAKEREEAHSKTVIRIEFPDRTVLQGVFSPTETVATVRDLVCDYLRSPGPTTLSPPKLVLAPEQTLLDAGLVPTGKVYCKTVEDLPAGVPFLKEEVINAIATFQEASRAAAIARSRDARVKDAEETNLMPPPARTSGSNQAVPKGAASILKFLSKSSATSNLKKS